MSDFDLSRHPHFAALTDPQSGVVSYVLSEHLAPLQKAIYFVTPTIGTGSRWLWFYLTWPPSRQWQLGVVSLDPDQPEIRQLPGSIVAGNPLLIGDGSEALVPMHDGVYRMNVAGEREQVFRIPGEWVNGRHIYSLCTEITQSADGRYVLMDSRVGNRSLIWVWDNQVGEAKLLRSLHRFHHHTIFSLTDPELFLISQAPHYDPHTGEKVDMDIRIWLMDVRQSRFEPLCADLWFGHNSLGCHEWWTPDGKVQWCDYNDGIYEVAVHGEDRKRQLIWPRQLIHGQVDPTGRFICGDYHPYKWNADNPCSVYLFDRPNERETVVAGNLPEPPLPAGDRRSYHVDPHPHFSANGDWLIHTTTHGGELSVAICPTQQFAEDDSDVRWSPV